MINCKKATELASRRHEQPLTLREKMAFKFHLMVCGACKKFDRNVDSLGALMLQFKQYDSNKEENEKLGEHSKDSPAADFSPEAQEKSHKPEN